jgi:hypothetical protein
MQLESGFTILKRYEVLYSQAIASRRFHREGVAGPVYAIPLGEDPEPQGAPRYRGLNRDRVHPVFPDYSESFIEMLGRDQETLEASRAIGEIFERLDPGAEWLREWLPRVDDAQHVWERLGRRRHEYEVIFARAYQDTSIVPESAYFLGCDAADPYPGGFSCISDALFFPVWHGTDPEGVLFAEHFARLNQHGLFDTHDEAFDYLRCYLSFDWTERSHLFTSVEIYAVDMASVL